MNFGKSILGLVGMAAFGSVAFAAPSASSDAVVGPGLGTWEGSGNVRALNGQDLGAFDVSLTRTRTGTGSRTDGRVVLADGKTIAFWQNIEGRGNGFRVTSNNGNGGGQCFTNGMCQLYETREADGHAFATTLAKDGDRHLRILVTELERGSAVRFFEQTLTKKD